MNKRQLTAMDSKLRRMQDQLRNIAGQLEGIGPEHALADYAENMEEYLDSAFASIQRARDTIQTD